MTHEEIFKEAIKQWGSEAQINQAVEECAEFIVAVNKLRRAQRWGNGEQVSSSVEDLVGEIADVINCMEQMKMMFGKDETDAKIEFKMKRLKSRLGL